MMIAVECVADLVLDREANEKRSRRTSGPRQSVPKGIDEPAAREKRSPHASGHRPLRVRTVIVDERVIDPVETEAIRRSG
jgi:hypothetical protein